MAQGNMASSKRPLSPHLQIWRWTWAMRVSILHRLSGNGLAFAGLGILLWWLGAMASGPDAYATFSNWVWPDLAQLQWTGLGMVIASLVKIGLKLTLIGISWAFFNHMASGIRHFVLDIGAGFELTGNARWSVLTPLIAILLTAAFWVLLLR